MKGDPTDAASLGNDSHSFTSRASSIHPTVLDVAGNEIPVDCSATRFSTRNKLLALVVARPC